MSDITQIALWKDVSASGVGWTAVRKVWRQKEKLRRYLHISAFQSMNLEMEYIISLCNLGECSHNVLGVAKITILFFFGWLALPAYCPGNLTSSSRFFYI